MEWTRKDLPQMWKGYEKTKEQMDFLKTRLDLLDEIKSNAAIISINLFNVEGDFNYAKEVCKDVRFANPAHSPKEIYQEVMERGKKQIDKCQEAYDKIVKAIKAFEEEKDA